MQKMINALTELATQQHRFKNRTHQEINDEPDKQLRDFLIEQFTKESATYKATVYELCRMIILAEAIAVDEEVFTKEIVSAANLAISHRFSKQRIYNAIVDAIDFTFTNTDRIV